MKEGRKKVQHVEDFVPIGKSTPLQSWPPGVMERINTLLGDGSKSVVTFPRPEYWKGEFGCLFSLEGLHYSPFFSSGTPKVFISLAIE